MVSRAVPIGSFGVVLVEAARNLAPVDARDRLAPQVRLMRQLMGESAVLVIVPWLSPRTREVLETNGFGYLDLTGNISFRLRRPLVFLRQPGADRDPNPPSRGRHGLAGARAGNLVRLLVDVAPPYRAGELAATSGISLPWVGRLLEAMEAQALIRRDGRTVVDTDWVGLLRERAATIDLLKMNNAVPMVAPAGHGAAPLLVPPTAPGRPLQLQAAQQAIGHLGSPKHSQPYGRHALATYRSAESSVLARGVSCASGPSKCCVMSRTTVSVSRRRHATSTCSCSCSATASARRPSRLCTSSRTCRPDRVSSSRIRDSDRGRLEGAAKR